MHVQQMQSVIARHRKLSKPVASDTLQVVEALRTDWTKPDIDVAYALERRGDRDVSVERWYFVGDFGFTQEQRLDWCQAIYVPQFSTPSQRKTPPACGLPRKNLMGVCLTTCGADRRHEGMLICHCRRWNALRTGRSVGIYELCLTCMVHRPHLGHQYHYEYEDARDLPISPLIYAPSI